MHTFTSGAKSTEPGTRYDLLELAFLKRVADRMAQGAASHGERNYLKGAADPQFIQDRKNHLIAHVLKYVAGDTSDDHLAAAGANLNMLAEIDRVRDSRKTYDEARMSAGPCPHCARTMVMNPCAAPGACALDRNFPQTVPPVPPDTGEQSTKTSKNVGPWGDGILRDIKDSADCWAV